MFLLPAMLGIFIFKLYTIFLGMYDSFFQYSFQNKRDFFVGIQNYVDAFQDPSFLNSLAVTLIFNVIVNPLQAVSYTHLQIRPSSRRASRSSGHAVMIIWQFPLCSV